MDNTPRLHCQALYAAATGTSPAATTQLNFRNLINQLINANRDRLSSRRPIRALPVEVCPQHALKDQNIIERRAPTKPIERP
ncbi:hypothetical protein VTN96DRAFT_3408 [Rasamsonia emersonii]